MDQTGRKKLALEAGVADRSMGPPRSVLALKGSVLKVLLSQPGGVAVSELERLFCQHHGWPLEFHHHGYHSLQHLLGDMADLVVLAEEENELQVRCQRPTCHLTGTPMKTPQVQVEEWAGPEPPLTGSRAWSSCHNLSTPHSYKPQAKPHRKRRTRGRGKASIPHNRTISLSHLPQSHLPVALLSSSNQPLSLEHFQATPPVPPVLVPTLAPGPSLLPCPQHPAKPQRDSPAASQAFLQAELEQKVAMVLEGHPEGMSLFHFRQAYSATYLTSFPLDGATSVKDKLLAMPSMVRVQGCGVQTLVFPATSQSPATSPKWPFITGEDEGHIGLFQSFPEAASASASASSTAARSPSVMSCLPPSTSASSLDAQYYANSILVPSTCERHHEAPAPQATALGYKKCHKHKLKPCIIL